ncbi:hypothetical protein [Streptomyces sp. MBT53]|uniref:hypothetical protein n=1 Tax=Streptomyces sp. MBT53 TaxID=1488384 RepID=UPI001912673B|nr:hypothetical protein [Streptomyces sp. MBT53]MBK6016872.1 hypothetical protein [Streptomyces sp. MBT53]
MIVHDLAFESNPSRLVKALAACFLFVVALPGAGSGKSLRTQVLLAFGCQAVIGYWFVLADSSVAFRDHGLLPSSVLAGWPVVIGHILLALLCAVLLHGLDDSVRRVLYAAGKEWCALRALLRTLLVPGHIAYKATESGAAGRVDSGPTRAPSSSALLAGAVVRRGPPHLPLPYPAA